MFGSLGARVRSTYVTGRVTSGCLALQSGDILASEWQCWRSRAGPSGRPELVYVAVMSHVLLSLFRGAGHISVVTVSALCCGAGGVGGV